MEESAGVYTQGKLGPRVTDSVLMPQTQLCGFGERETQGHQYGCQLLLCEQHPIHHAGSQVSIIVPWSPCLRGCDEAATVARQGPRKLPTFGHLGSEGEQGQGSSSPKGTPGGLFPARPPLWDSLPPSAPKAANRASDTLEPWAALTQTQEATVSFHSLPRKSVPTLIPTPTLKGCPYL